MQWFYLHYPFYSKTTLLGLGSEWPKDQALLLVIQILIQAVWVIHFRSLLLVFRCHFVEQNGVTIITYSDRFGGRGQGKFIVAAGITKNSSAVPAMMLEQGKKSRQLKMSQSRPSVDQCHTQPKQPAPSRPTIVLSSVLKANLKSRVLAWKSARGTTIHATLPEL
jgi:hypothetical protein